MLDPERVWAIVPVKPLETAKSRLAPALRPEERRALCLGMLEHVLDALAATGRIGYRAVVSPDPWVLSLARGRGGLPVQDHGLELNDALRLGVAAALTRGAEAVVILPADLPLLRGRELHGLVVRAMESPCVVVARAAADGGTNALLVRPPRALEPSFGVNSFEAHCRQARERGIPLHLFEAPGLAFDLDTPESLAAVQAAGLTWLGRSVARPASAGASGAPPRLTAAKPETISDAAEHGEGEGRWSR